MDEFSLINTWFKPLGDVADSASPNVVLGVGDDCALLASRPGYELAVTADTLVAGVHFLEDVDAVDLGVKALAVNLSDLAAMGAEPAWFTLCLTLPEQDPAWLEGFSEGLGRMAREYRVPLVGGDTTSGPLTVTVQVAGWVPQGRALRRDAARTDDLIYVSGELGWPGLGLAHLQQQQTLSEPHRTVALERLLRPRPQIKLAMAIREHVHACIDISDGLTADLTHILKASGKGAELDIPALPVAEPLRKLQSTDRDALLEALNFGDEYQLLFTAPASAGAALKQAAATAGAQVHSIGRITDTGQLADTGGAIITAKGYRHFS
ncbi:MAG: thiamine-phosphate kinase [Ketobacteraceae bacterium]|nr:thiamine-phosphate kinase [Ketobacteraceae bacterium]